MCCMTYIYIHTYIDVSDIHIYIHMYIYIYIFDVHMMIAIWIFESFARTFESPKPGNWNFNGGIKSQVDLVSKRSGVPWSNNGVEVGDCGASMDIRPPLSYKKTGQDCVG